MMELLVIGVVALIVVGPKDLPGMFRTVGRFVGKAKGMAREFQRAMEDAAEESGVKEATDGLKDLNSMRKLGLDDIATSTKNYAENYKSSKAPPPVDAAAEHAARQAKVDQANAAAESWPPEWMDESEAAEFEGPDEVAEVAATPAPAKKPAKKPAAKKPAAKKPAAKKPAAAKTAVKKPAAKKPAAKTSAAKTGAKTAAKKPAAAKSAAKTPKNTGSAA
jgi:sec-independent protein translocase protein TatB